MLAISIILLINLFLPGLSAKCSTHLSKEEIDDTFTDSMSYERAQTKIVGVTTTCTNVTLPLESFVGSSCEDCIRELEINSSNIQTLPRTAFHGIRNLNTLRLDSTNTSYIEPGAFAEMNKLQQLYITNNNILRILNNTFNPLPQLKTLDLSHNALTEVEPNFLAGNLNLTYLNMSSNRLTLLNFKDTDRSIKLVSINVQNNLISTINFANISANFAYFSHNTLRQIQGCTLNVQNLDLSYNNMSTLPSIDKNCSKYQFRVRILKLSHNALTQLDDNFFNAFPNLTSLDVSYNMIGRLPIAFFQYFPALNIFDVSHNMLDEFNIGLLDTDRYLEYVNVSYNKISVVKGRIVANHHEKNVEIRMQCNPIQCNTLIPFITFLPTNTKLYVDIRQKSFTWENLKDIRGAATKSNVTIIHQPVPGCGDDGAVRNTSVKNSNRTQISTANLNSTSALGNITEFINNVLNSSKALEATLDHSYTAYNDSICATDGIYKLLAQLESSIHDAVDKMNIPQQTKNDPKACGRDEGGNDSSGLLTAIIVLLVFVIVLFSILVTGRYARNCSYFIRQGEENIELLNDSNI
nr:unnamed protein product [Callosobruchus chinensis]